MNLKMLAREIMIGNETNVSNLGKYTYVSETDNSFKPGLRKKEKK